MTLAVTRNKNLC